MSILTQFESLNKNEIDFLFTFLNDYNESLKEFKQEKLEAMNVANEMLELMNKISSKVKSTMIMKDSEGNEYDPKAMQTEIDSAMIKVDEKIESISNIITKIQGLKEVIEIN